MPDLPRPPASNPHSASAQGRRLVWTFALALLVLNWCAITFKIHNEESLEIASINQDNLNLARALEEHTLRTLKSVDQAVMFVDERRPGQSYTLRLRFLGDRMIADEQGALEYFGVGAHLAGEYHRPDLTSDRATPALAPQRLTIREKSAAEILGNLKGIPSYRFHESVEQLYLERWTREPGWQATVYDLPSKLSGELWHCSFKEAGSDTLVLASTVQDVSTLRPGDSVTVSGRIRDVSQVGSVSLKDAIVRGENVPFL